eukprot:1321853-Rhodomonas_salina.2
MWCGYAGRETGVLRVFQFCWDRVPVRRMQWGRFNATPCDYVGCILILFEIVRGDLSPLQRLPQRIQDKGPVSKCCSCLFDR